MERAIVDILENDAAVDAIVSKRIFPNTIPQNKIFPTIVYSVVTTTPSNHKDGVSQLDSINIDLDMFWDDYKKLRDLADKVRTALDFFSGTKQSQVIARINFENQICVFDNDADLFHITQTYLVRHKI